LKQAETDITRILEMPNAIVAQVEHTVHQAMDVLPQSLPPGLRRVLFESEQKSLLEAALSDLVGEIPFAEFLIKPFRIREAALHGEPETATRHAVDWTLPLPFPANIRRYLREKLGR
jgi:hypothetical protein